MFEDSLLREAAEADSTMALRPIKLGLRHGFPLDMLAECAIDVRLGSRDHHERGP